MLYIILLECEDKMEIIQIFKNEYNNAQAISMKKYMRNQFSFLGIKNPQRQLLQKDFVNKNKDSINWQMIKILLKEDEREFFYLVLDYLKKRKKLLKINDFEKIEFLITYKSWWDSIDIISPHLVGQLVTTYPQLKKEVIRWSRSDNIWLKRSSILYQLKFREELDKEILMEIIENTKDTENFFIEKAIGWILREYSKTNPIWVESYLNKATLPVLSRTEGSKYITSG